MSGGQVLDLSRVGGRGMRRCRRKRQDNKETKAQSKVPRLTRSEDYRELPTSASWLLNAVTFRVDSEPNGRVNGRMARSHEQYGWMIIGVSSLYATSTCESAWECVWLWPYGRSPDAPEPEARVCGRIFDTLKTLLWSCCTPASLSLNLTVKLILAPE